MVSSTRTGLEKIIAGADLTVTRGRPGAALWRSDPAQPGKRIFRRTCKTRSPLGPIFAISTSSVRTSCRNERTYCLGDETSFFCAIRDTSIRSHFTPFHFSWAAKSTDRRSILSLRIKPSPPRTTFQLSSDHYSPKIAPVCFRSNESKIQMEIQFVLVVKGGCA